MYALTQGKQSGKHVPYRDSKLTRILQNTFGGNSRTAMIINSSPAEHNHRETLSSLRFGDRTQAVRNAPTANVHRSAEELEKLLEMAEKELTETRDLAREDAAGLSSELAQLTEERNYWRSKVDDLKVALVAAQAALANKDNAGGGAEDDVPTEDSDTEDEDVKSYAGHRGGAAGGGASKTAAALAAAAAGETESPVVRTSSASAVRMAALRTLSTLAPAPLRGEELFTMLRASPWAVVIADSEDRNAQGVEASDGGSPRGGVGGVGAAMYGSIIHFESSGLTVTGNDLWRSLVARRRGPITPGRGGGGVEGNGLHTERAGVAYRTGGGDSLVVSWGGLGADAAELDSGGLMWTVEMIRRDGEETVEITGELLPPVRAAGGGATTVTTLVLQRVPASVVGVVMTGLAVAHERMREAEVTALQKQRGWEKSEASKKKLQATAASAHEEASADTQPPTNLVKERF